MAVISHLISNFAMNLKKEMQNSERKIRNES